MSVKARSEAVEGGEEIRVPETRRMVGARQLKTLASKEPIEKPASPPL